MSAPSRQRFVVASLGSIGRRHLGNLRQSRPAAEIAVLRRRESDTDIPDHADRVFVTVEDALDFRPHAAILAGPAPTHVPLAQAFVERDVAVLIEKPLSHDLGGLAQLADTAANRGVPVMVAYNLRFKESLRTVQAAVTAGSIGEILSVRAEVGQYLPSWRPASDYRKTVSARNDLGGGVLLELSHEIDYIFWMFGLPARVMCRGGHLSDLDIDVEDCVELCLEYEVPRRLVSIHLDFLRRRTARTCTLIGTLGTIHWDAMADSVCIDTAEPTPECRTIAPPPIDRNDTYRAELAAFLSTVERGMTAPIPLSDGIAVMRIIAAARRSMRSGRVEVPSLTEEVR